MEAEEITKGVNTRESPGSIMRLPTMVPECFDDGIGSSLGRGTPRKVG